MPTYLRVLVLLGGVAYQVQQLVAPLLVALGELLPVFANEMFGARIIFLVSDADFEFAGDVFAVEILRMNICQCVDELRQLLGGKLVASFDWANGEELALVPKILRQILLDIWMNSAIRSTSQIWR